MQARSCSIKGNLCPKNFSCYVQEDGFFCKPSNTTGCIVATKGNIQFVNKQLVDIGVECEHCPVPHSKELRNLFQPKLSQIVQDDGWVTYGNCQTGFCGQNNSCRLTKESYSLCLTNDQCSGGICAKLPERGGRFACQHGGKGSSVIANIWVGRTLAAFGIFMVLISLIAIIMLRKNIRKGSLSTPLVKPTPVKGRVPKYNFDEEDAVALEEVMWLRRKVALTIYMCSAFGIIVAIYGIGYSLMPPSAFPHDDVN
ncbi:hypothetical protein BDF19DRAFT_410677 [Syncephalis fuscata]|nr:hypothetical protein BDF19DRAFT_410677 [Syncephalis fuscata]